MVAEVYAGLSAFKAMFDMAKGLKDMNDAAIRNGAVIELQEQILGAQQAQTTLLERISDLEKEVARFETWDTDKKKYEMKQLARSAASFAYAVKPNAQGAEPFHCICAACYQNRVISILQFLKVTMIGGNQHTLKCPVCTAEIQTESWPPPNLGGGA